MIRQFIHSFALDEDGAITVDWLMLTAMIVVLATSIGLAVKTSTDDVTTAIGQELTDQSVLFAKN